jgi:diadenosine tetraphosphate (Ap4A) HIT family hydrolase
LPTVQLLRGAALALRSPLSVVCDSDQGYTPKVGRQGGLGRRRIRCRCRSVCLPIRADCRATARAALNIDPQGVHMYERYRLDEDAYNRRAQSGPCFVCRILAGDPAFPHHMVYEDETAVAFLDAFPKMYGYTLVAPREHREQVTGDFDERAYVDLQRIVYRVAEAVRVEVGAERVYLLSLGSNQGNAHVHWHIAPLPRGVTYEQQQLRALRADIMRIPDSDQSALAERLRRRLKPAGRH